jgi:hypothetical protein
MFTDVPKEPVTDGAVVSEAMTAVLYDEKVFVAVEDAATVTVEPPPLLEAVTVTLFMTLVPLL